jgi:hypothetical protein
MRTWIKLTMAALAASLLLSVAISTALARNISISSQTFRITWASLEFVSTLTVRCPVTLEGSFHYRTIIKRERALIGLITRAIVNQPECAEGRAAAFNGVEFYAGIVPANTLPWHVTYENFTGTLPDITSLRLLLARFRFGFEIGGCAVQVGEATDNITGSVGVDFFGSITTLIPVEGRNEGTVIRTDFDPFRLCPRPGARGRLRGTGNVTVLGAATRITVRLI